MSDFNTGNSVPSIDPRDLDDNATVFDQLLNSSASSVPDRLSRPRKTWAQMEIDAAALVSPNVAALAGLPGAPDRMPYFTGSGAMSLAVLSTVARTLNAATTRPAQHTALGLGSSAVLNAGVASGVATLGADGKLPVSQLPPLAVNDTFTVASQAAMLALTAERGDVAIRTDLAGAAYLLTTDTPGTLASWVPIQQNLGAALTALGAVTPAADKLAYFTGSGTATLADFPLVARTLLAATTPGQQRSALTVLAASDKPAWTAYTPTVTASTGTFTSATATGKYLVLYGICHVQVRVTVTTVGTGVIPDVTLPFPALSGSVDCIIPARESLRNGKLGAAVLLSNLTQMRCKDYANADLVTADGSVIVISGSYPIA